MQIERASKATTPLFNMGVSTGLLGNQPALGGGQPPINTLGLIKGMNRELAAGVMLAVELV